MAQMVRVGPAPAGSVPFFKGQNGGIGFDGQGGRMLDYGHTFDPERGYRVFFKFRDSDASNTWGPESLIAWCDSFEAADADQHQLQRTARQQARQCIALNTEWQRLGRPATGLPDTPQGSA